MLLVLIALRTLKVQLILDCTCTVMLIIYFFFYRCVKLLGLIRNINFSFSTLGILF